MSEPAGAGMYVTFAPLGPVASTVCFGGTMIVGAASVTVTVKLPEPVFPAASRAVHVTIVRPIRNVDPEAGVHVTGRGPSTTSLADAPNVTTRPAALVASAVMFAGVFTAGAAASRTVTVNVSEPVFPRASEAVHLTVVAPIAKADPDAGEHVGVSEPLTASLAVAVKSTVALVPFVPISIGAGIVTVGGWVSSTVTRKLPVALLPALSVALQPTVVVPIGKVDPELGEHDTETRESMLSVAVAPNDTTPPPALVASRVMFDGRSNVGGPESRTVTENVAEP